MRTTIAGISAALILLTAAPSSRRLTSNEDGDAFPALSPDGKKIGFDSNLNRAEGEPLNTSDLFLMNTDGSEQTLLTRGSSASWSPDSKNIAFHASASGTGLPIKPDPGAATSDSDIFIANVDDLPSEQPRNITNSPATIDDDPDWSPGGQRIAFTSHAAADDPGPDFEICTMHADGSDQVQLTNNTVADLTPSWSPDGSEIAFHRPAPGRFQLSTMNADGTGVQQLTNTPGLNLFANWGELRVRGTP